MTRPVLVALVACALYAAGRQDARAGELTPVTLQGCDRVEVRLDDPAEREMGERLADLTCRHLRRMEELFGQRLRRNLQVRMLPDMAAWRERTGRAWYIAAVLMGDSIVTQPARSRRKLESIERSLAHELAHLFIRRAAGRNCPCWLDEGLAQILAGDRSGTGGPDDEKELAALESRLNAPDTGRQIREQDYRATRALVRRLIDQVGQKKLLRALWGLRTAKDPLQLIVEGRSLHKRLFSVLTNGSGRD